MTGERGDRLVRVGVAADEVEANVWRDVLQQEGIAVYVKKADPLSSMGVATSFPASFEVYVLAADERRARWLLGEPAADERV